MMSKVKQSSILKFIGGTVLNPTVAVTPLRQWEEDLNPGDLDDGRGRKDCIEDDSQAPVNVSESHLASLEPAANHNVRNDEIPEKFHPPKTYKFPKRKFGSTVITERSFQPQWCDTYKWLHYDKVADAAFCHLCMGLKEKESFSAAIGESLPLLPVGLPTGKKPTKVSASINLVNVTRKL